MRERRQNATELVCGSLNEAPTNKRGKARFLLLWIVGADARRMKTLVVLLLLSVLCHGKEIGLHDAASDKYRQHIHEDLKISRISVIEEEVAMEHHFHPWNGTSAHKHLSVIGMVEGSPSTAYVRVLGDHEEDGSHPMHEHEAVHAIWVKDEEGKIVHLTEFDDKYAQ
jgi:hypothetical protein